MLTISMYGSGKMSYTTVILGLRQQYIYGGELEVPPIIINIVINLIKHN